MNWTKGKQLFRDYALNMDVGRKAVFSHYGGWLENIYIIDNDDEVEVDIKIFNDTQTYSVSFPNRKYTLDIEFHKALLQVMIDLGWDRE